MPNVSLNEMVEFFDLAYGEQWPGQIIICIFDIFRNPKNPDKVISKLISEFGITSLEQLRDKDEAALHLMQDKGYHFFYTVCPTDFEPSRKKANVMGTFLLWADVDHVDEEEMRGRIAGIPIPPTGIIRTGGGYHLYWKLDRFYKIDEDVEEALLKVRKWVGGDTTQDVTRLLRIPGTWNFGKHKGYTEPYKCEKVNWLRPAVYTLEEFLATRFSFNEIRLAEEFKTKYILKGEFIGENQDRSTRDFAVIKELLIAGHTEEEIIDIFTNTAFECSSKAVEKGEVNGKKYIQHTIKKAGIDVAATEKGSVYDDGQVILKKSVGKSGVVSNEPLSNFCVVPLHKITLVTNGSSHVEIKIIHRGLERTLTVATDSLLSWQNLVKTVATPGMTFTGAQTDWQHYIKWIFDKDIPSLKATDVVGWQGKSFVLSTETWFEGGVRYVNTGLVPPRIQVTAEEFDVENFMKFAGQNLERLRPQVAFPTFAWFLAAAFAPQVRAKTFGQFPILCLEGEPGSGKTTLTEAMQQYLFGVMDKHSFGDSIAIFRRAIAGRNSIPFLVDEYEHDASNKAGGAEQVNLILRVAFQGGGASRFDSQQKISEEIQLVGPIALTSARGIKDEALIDRTLVLRVPGLPRPEKRGGVLVEPPDLARGKKGLEWLRGAVPGAVLRWWLQQDPTPWLNQIQHYAEMVYCSQRRQLGFGLTTSILLHLAERFKWNNVCEKFCLNWWETHQKSVISYNPNGAIDTAVATLIDKRILLKDTHWIVGNDCTVKIHQRALVDEIVKIQKELDLSYPADRKWFLKTLGDCEAKGEVARTNYPTSMGGVMCKATWFRMEFFPEVTEAVGRYEKVEEEKKEKEQ